MTGTITISIEIELGWGVARFDKLDKLSPGREAETTYLSRLLDLCDEHDIGITFDVVGHLFHESCEGDHGGPHPAGWWDVDPGTSVAEDPLFYAPDLVEDIQSREAGHEICTHTYSHVECDKVCPEVVAWEIERSNQVHRRHGIPASESIVPPRHGPPPADVLTERGVEIKRVPHYRAEGVERPATRPGKLYEILIDRHPTSDPKVVDGVLETYSTEYTSLAAPYLRAGTYDPHPVYRTMPLSSRQRLHEWNLRRCLKAAEKSDVHLWCHLYDLANERQWPQIESFIEQLGRRTDNDRFEVQTMRELARENVPESGVAKTDCSVNGLEGGLTDPGRRPVERAGLEER